MHRALIVKFQVDVQNSILILVINHLFSPLIVRLGLFAVGLGQTLALTIERDARPDHGLRILLPDRVLKRCIIRLRRRYCKHVRDVLYLQGKALLLGTQLHQPRIGRMCRKNFCDAHDGNIRCLSALLPSMQEKKHCDQQQQTYGSRHDFPTTRFPEFHASPSVMEVLRKHG